MTRSLRLGLLIALLLAAGLTIPAHHAVTAQPADAGGAYIALGDSIAFGVGGSLPERRSYPALVHAYLEVYRGGIVPFVNLAVPGETAAAFVPDGQFNAFLGELQKFEQAGIGVEVVTVSLGGNEMLAQQYSGAPERQAALDEFRVNLNLAISQIRSETDSDTDIVLTTYYDLSEGDASIPMTDAWWIEQFNTVIREAAESAGAGVADLTEPFRGNIQDFTYHPYDVHPDNQGYRAIARQVWDAIALDQEPPAIEVVSEPGASRRTPTLQFVVMDNVDVARVGVAVNDGPDLAPVNRGDGHYVLLLDLRNDDAEEYSVLIEAEDSAGNVVQTEHRLGHPGRLEGFR